MYEWTLSVLQVENLDVAFDLYQEMLDRRIEPNTTTHTTLLNLCAESGQGDRAVEFMRVC